MLLLSVTLKSIGMSCRLDLLTMSDFYNITHWSFGKYWSYTELPNIDTFHNTITRNHIRD